MTFSQNIMLMKYLRKKMTDCNTTKGNGGLHYSTFFVGGKQYSSFQPRLSFRYLIDSKSSFKMGYAKMGQFLHLLTNSGIGLPTDLWVPATKKIKPQFSDQIAAGYARTFNDKIEVSLEGYFKTMNNLMSIKMALHFLILRLIGKIKFTLEEVGLMEENCLLKRKWEKPQDGLDILYHGPIDSLIP